jgi:hypothetical protein
MPAVRHAHLAELPTAHFDDPDDPDWTPLRHLLGISAFGVNVLLGGEPGAMVVERHDEDDHEELYVMLEGEAEFTVGDERIAARPGTVVFVGEPSLTRQARVTRAPARVLAIGGVPGRAFEPSPWEGELLEKTGLATARE